MMLAGFLVFLALFLLVGFLSSRRSDGSTGDYYLAGRSVSPMLVGLSRCRHKTIAATCSLASWASPTCLA